MNEGLTGLARHEDIHEYLMTEFSFFLVNYPFKDKIHFMCFKEKIQFYCHQDKYSCLILSPRSPLADVAHIPSLCETGLKELGQKSSKSQRSESTLHKQIYEQIEHEKER